MTTTKPVALKAGMPKAESNGLYGAEDRIMEDSTEQIIVVAVMAVSKIMLEEIEDERYPIVEFVSIEPLFDPAAQDIVRELRRKAMVDRQKNPNQLDIDGDQAPADEAAADQPGEDDETEIDEPLEDVVSDTTEPAEPFMAPSPDWATESGAR